MNGSKAANETGQTNMSTYRRWVLHYRDNNNNVVKIMEHTSGDDQTHNWNLGLLGRISRSTEYSSVPFRNNTNE